jgi:hypothetical protein
MPLASTLSLGPANAADAHHHGHHHHHVNAFQHTQLGVYLAGGSVLLYVAGDLLPSLLDAHHVARHWLWLMAMLAAAAWLYARPFIRGLGSAHR